LPLNTARISYSPGGTSPGTACAPDAPLRRTPLASPVTSTRPVARAGDAGAGTGSGSAVPAGRSGEAAGRSGLGALPGRGRAGGGSCAPAPDVGSGAGAPDASAGSGASLG